MICVCCKSQFMYSQIKEICSAHINKEVIYSNFFVDVKIKLQTGNIETVFFDSEMFVDTAKLRAVSPNTRFIAIARNGFEDELEKAILNGACDFILCPCLEQGVVDCL